MSQPLLNSEVPPFQPDLRRLHENLSRRIRGQPEIIGRLVRKLLRRELNAVPQRGSRGNFILVGPTGTGKTELALAVSELLFGPGGLARLDCSEVKTVESVMALLGDRDSGRGRFAQLHAEVPAGVWLVDEIEKSHPEFAQLFLQMTATGRITLANGAALDLRRIYIFVTSNLGGAEILGREHLPFVTLEKYVTRCVRRHLRPELVARFGAPLVFRPLNRGVQTEIAATKLDELIDWNRQQGREISCEDGVVRLLVQRGFSPELGARPLLDTIEELAGDAIVEQLLAGGHGHGRLATNGTLLRLKP